MQNLVQHWGCEVLAHPPYSPDLAPSNYWLFAYIKNIEGKQFESEGNINTAVNAPVHRPSKDEYRTATDCLPHR
jgi:histone-lysine N-methyltransferase SETMAR